jgi:hypothetical protein
VLVLTCRECLLGRGCSNLGAIMHAPNVHVDVSQMVAQSTVNHVKAEVTSSNSLLLLLRRHVKKKKKKSAC